MRNIDHDCYFGSFDSNFFSYTVHRFPLSFSPELLWDDQSVLPLITRSRTLSQAGCGLEWEDPRPGQWRKDIAKKPRSIGYIKIWYHIVVKVIFLVQGNGGSELFLQFSDSWRANFPRWFHQSWKYEERIGSYSLSLTRSCWRYIYRLNLTDLWVAHILQLVFCDKGLSILVGFTWETTMDGCTASWSRSPASSNGWFFSQPLISTADFFLNWSFLFDLWPIFICKWSVFHICSAFFWCQTYRCCIFKWCWSYFCWLCCWCF